MNAIERATLNDVNLLTTLSRQTFIESHGKSASPSDIDYYVNEKYSYEAIEKELSDVDNIYHIIYHKTQPIGFSKILLNSPISNFQMESVTKLERLYLLKAFYKLKLGQALFNFNVEVSKNNKQVGMWLYVWKENERAVNFYIKNGFEIIGSHDFKISATHSNPNHQMFLKY